jgi:two-component sensor histidine kinase
MSAQSHAADLGLDHGDVHQLIGRAQCQALSLAELLERALSPYAALGEDRFDPAGPDIALEPNLVLALHLVFHELASNASKHGALSWPFGWVKIRWELMRVADVGLVLTIVWSEHAGPKVAEPKRGGFGRRLIAAALAQTQGQADLHFGANGVICRICVRVDGLSTGDPVQ